MNDHSPYSFNLHYNYLGEHSLIHSGKVWRWIEYKVLIWLNDLNICQHGLVPILFVFPFVPEIGRIEEYVGSVIKKIEVIQRQWKNEFCGYFYIFGS